MKHVIFLIDGMADEPLPELGGLTPLEKADTPNIDSIARNAQFGTFLTLPSAFPTSSDVANMSVLGWDLATCYTGRGAIETFGAGYELPPDTVAYRMNLITVKDGLVEDYSAGHISEAEAAVLVDYLSSKLGTEEVRFLKGVSYRHLLHLKGSRYSSDIGYDKPDSSHGMAWKDILPRALSPEAEHTAELLRSLVIKSEELLKDHPVNKKRTAAGKNPANLIWPWSGGKRPVMPTFEQMYGIKGAIISAVDVILGLGRLGSMDSLRPEGATGWIDTNYENKAQAAVDFLKQNDFVYLHVEGVDECGHLGDLEKKISAIEDCDRRLIGVFLDLFRKQLPGEGLRAMVLPDHPVPVRLRKHTRDLVPFMLWGSGVDKDPDIQSYSEKTCLNGRYTGLKGRELMDLLIRDGKK